MWRKVFYKKMIDYTCTSESPFKFPLNSSKEILKMKKVTVVNIRENRSGDNSK